jgi:hypothetical protein
MFTADASNGMINFTLRFDGHLPKNSKKCTDVHIYVATKGGLKPLTGYDSLQGASIDPSKAFNLAISRANPNLPKQGGKAYFSVWWSFDGRKIENEMYPVIEYAPAVVPARR